MGRCLNRIIEQKTSSTFLEIRLPRGSFTLEEAVIVYQKDSILISSHKKGTHISLSESIKANRDSSILQYFTFLVIDSNGFQIDGVELDGAGFSGQRGIAVCPLYDHALSAFKITGLSVRNFGGFFTLIGNAVQENHFAIFLNQSPNTLSPGARRLYDQLKIAKASGSVLRCGGSVRNIEFSRNELELKEVGFYLAPYSMDRTRTAVLESLTTPGTRWNDLVLDLANDQSEIIVKGNQFRVNPSGLTQTEEKNFHSFIKAQTAAGMEITDNSFDSGTSSLTFGGGAMVNLAAGMRRTSISGNRFTFGSGHAYQTHAIGIMSGFTTHTLYGVGTIGLFSPSVDVTISNNDFSKNNAKSVRVFNCCDRETASYCTEMDTAPFDKIVLNGNRLNGVATPTQNLISLVSVDEKAWVNSVNASDPGKTICRQNVQIQN